MAAVGIKLLDSVWYIYFTTVDPSQRTTPFRYCCYIRQALPLSRHTLSSRSEKYSNEETDKALTDKTETVHLGMKKVSALKVSFF